MWTFVTTFGVHLDNPESSPYFKVLKLGITAESPSVYKATFIGPRVWDVSLQTIF